MGIRCQRILSQHLKISLRSSHIIAPHVWLVGIVRGITTQTGKDSRDKLWSYVFSERPLFIVHDSISLSPLDEAKWHAWRHSAGYTVASVVASNCEKCETIIRPHLSQRNFRSKNNKRSMRWFVFPTSMGPTWFHVLMHFICQGQKIQLAK